MGEEIILYFFDCIALYFLQGFFCEVIFINSMFKSLNGSILVCLAATMWGFDAIVLTPRLYHLSVPFVVFILHCLPAIGMTMLFGKEEFQNIKKIPKKDFIFFFLVALCGGALGTLSIIKALFLVNFQHLTVVTLLQKLQPIFAIALAMIFLKERFKNSFGIWVLIALVSGYFLTFEFTLPEVNVGDNLLLACFYSLLAAFSFGGATVFGKRILHVANFRTALYIRYVLTTLIMFVIVIYQGQMGEIFKATYSDWGLFILIGLTTGSFAIYIYYIGLSTIKAGVSTICELCFPVSSVLFDYVFNGHILSPFQMVMAAVMVFSIIRISKLTEKN